jgi:hypothetical protein
MFLVFIVTNANYTIFSTNALIILQKKGFLVFFKHNTQKYDSA